MSESTVTITVDEEKKKETAREQPVWMKESTIEGASNDTMDFVSLSVTYGRSVVSSTNKTDSYDIAEILLKVTYNTIAKTCFQNVVSSILYDV